MRPIAGWSHLMSNTVSFAAQTGKDGYAKPTYGTAVSYQCHLSHTQKMVRTASGQVVQSQQCVHLNSADAILPTALATLSTADVGSTEAALVHPTIVAVERTFDRSAPHHTVVYF